MNKTTAVKQVITLALIVLVLVVIIPLVKRSFKSVPGLEARVGETFTVTLDSSADAAFRWDLLATDETKVQLVDHPDAKEAIASTEVWTFRALAPGKVTLYFGYLRLDSPNSPAIRTHSVQLTVNP
ncbi:MAG TPA: protease inhibitor I42 family protein [Clostridia bacterium]|nr:protease inhibitor I42 family protein [Clostridia bacterium]